MYTIEPTSIVSVYYGLQDINFWTYFWRSMQNIRVVVSGLSAILAFSSTYVHTSSSVDVLVNGKLLSLYSTVGRRCKKTEWGALEEL